MQPWQNYSMNNNPAYQQSMYQPMQNPYLDNRYANLQQYQQSISPTQMSGTSFPPLGKIVESIDIVKATDIPMDGNMYYFPKADGTEIFTKQWLANGTTQILTFKPIFDNEPNNSSLETIKTEIGLSDEVTEVFLSRFDDINSRLEKLEKSMRSTTRKKEVATDE